LKVSLAHLSPFPICRNRGTNQKRWGRFYTMMTALGFWSRFCSLHYKDGQ